MSCRNCGFDSEKNMLLLLDKGVPSHWQFMSKKYKERKEESWWKERIYICDKCFDHLLRDSEIERLNGKPIRKNKHKELEAELTLKDEEILSKDQEIITLKNKIEKDAISYKQNIEKLEAQLKDYEINDLKRRISELESRFSCFIENN